MRLLPLYLCGKGNTKDEADDANSECDLSLAGQELVGVTVSQGRAHSLDMHELDGRGVCLCVGMRKRTRNDV